MLQEVTAEIEKTAKAVVNEIHTALPGEIVSFCLLYTSPSPRDS